MMNGKIIGFALYLSLSLIIPAAAQMAGEDGGSMMGSGMMNRPVTSERDFIFRMIPHHQDAVDAAILVNATTSDGEIRSLSEEIYAEQTKEIIDLKLQYAKQYEALPTGDRMIPMMNGLDGVSGKERDRQFVRQMIPHHQGAVRMAQDVLKLPGISEETKSFARKTIKDQTDEISVMETWLSKNM